MSRFHFPTDSLMIFVTVLSAVSFAGTINAKKIRQTHRIEKDSSVSSRSKADNGKKEREVKVEKGSPVLTSIQDGTELNVTTDSIKIAGYDKPLNSSNETFHLINSSGVEINQVGIRITYLDLKNRMLHNREIPIDIILPAGETRLVSIPSWDIQKSFFYYLGAEPKKTATPYKVKMEIQWIRFREK